MLQILAGITKAASPEIIWRNQIRCPLSADAAASSQLGRGLCLVQEFVEAEESGFWLTISDLEVLSGGRAA